MAKENLRREYNSLTPKIALVILTVCLSIHILVVRRIKYWINYLPLSFFFFIFISFLLDIVLILMGEILSWSILGVKGFRDSPLKLLKITAEYLSLLFHSAK